MKTKLTVLMLVLTFGTISMMSCQKSDDSTPTNVGNSLNETANRMEVDEEGYFVLKPVFRFRWDGLWGNGSSIDCSGGSCGICPGLCFIWNFRLVDEPLDNEEIDEGLNYAKIKIDDETSRMYIRPDANMDTGSGFCIIEQDLDAEPESAIAFGYERITILGGSYEIDYSNSNLPFGEIVVTIEYE